MAELEGGDLTGEELRNALKARALAREAVAQGLEVGVVYDVMEGAWFALFHVSLAVWSATGDGQRADTMDLAIIAAAKAAGITVGG